MLNIVNTLGSASPDVVGDFKKFITDLYRDIHPELELRVWETMTAAHLEVVKHFELPTEERAEVVKLLLSCSLAYRRGIDESYGRLPNGVAYHAMKVWKLYAEVSDREAIVFTTDDADAGHSD
ncbi:MAG: hypothetical protein ACT4NP_16330 [Pseudonocardiales bacterium]